MTGRTASRVQGIAAVAAVLLAGGLVSGCGSVVGTWAPSPTSTTSLTRQLEALQGVSLVSGGDAELVVTMSPEASDDEVLAAGEQANSIASGTLRAASVVLVRGAAEVDPALDLASPYDWRVTVFPADPADIARELAGVLSVEDIGGASDISVLDGWPFVTIDPEADFAAVFAELAASELFSGGGTYTDGSGEHLQIVHVPERTTVEAIQTIATVADDYPTAEFLLQATTEGPQWPQLLVAHLDAAEGAALDARLREPDLADADPEGLPQQFQLTVVGPDGPTYIAGTLGDVPR